MVHTGAMMALARERQLSYVAALALTAACGDETRYADVVDPVYAEPCRFVSCSSHGQCVAAQNGEPVCLCNEGYAGAHCEGCQGGYHVDARGDCAPSQTCQEQEQDPCGLHGACVDQTGVITCACDTGYEGARCELCISGYGRNEFGECLQLVLGLDDGGVPLPATCSEATCSEHGRCDPAAGAVTCSCYPGYVGTRCDSCAEGYSPRGARCVEDATCAAGDCGACEPFAAVPAVPTQPDTCVSSGALALDGLTLESLGGSGPVWLCAASTIYGLGSEHVALEAGTTEPASLTFARAITQLALRYGARSFGPESDLTLEVAVDGRSRQTLTVTRGQAGALALDFDPPATTLTFRSLTPRTEQVALDDLQWEQASCP